MWQKLFPEYVGVGGECDDAAVNAVCFASEYSLNEGLTKGLFTAISCGQKSEAHAKAIQLGVPEELVGNWLDARLLERE